MEREVFVCHSSKDAAVAVRLCERLESCGIGCWIAPRDVLAGVSYPRQIVEAIQGCRVLLLVYSAAADRSPHVQRELETALQENVSILPFRLDAHDLSEDMRYFLGAQHWVHATAPDPAPGEQRLAEQVGALLNRIKVPRSGEGKVPASAASPGTGARPPANVPANASANASATTAASSRVARRVEALYQEAEACESSGDFAGAAAAYERILALAPEDPDAPRLLALARLELSGAPSAAASSGVAASNVVEAPSPRPAPRAPPQPSPQREASPAPRPPPSPRASPTSVAPVPRGDAGAGSRLDDLLAAARDGQTVRLVAGVHRLDRPIVLDKTLTLEGAGRETTSVVCAGEGHVVRFKGAGRLILRDVTLEHVGNADADVLRVASGAVLAERCAFRGAVEAAADGNEGSRGGDGIWACLDAVCEFVECVIAGNQGVGLLADGNARVTFRDGVVSDNGGGGIHVTGRAQAVISGNGCRDNGGSGIQFRGDSGGSAQGNACERNGKSGMYVDDRAAPSLRENVCTGNQDSGIAWFGDSRGTCESNRCDDNRTNGIYVGERAAPTVLKNVCAENDKDGISYRNESGGQCTGNRCRKNREDGIYVASGATVRLQGNVCVGNAGANIRDLR